MAITAQSSQFTENFLFPEAISARSLTASTRSVGYSIDSSEMVSISGIRLTISLTPSNAKNT